MDKLRHQYEIQKQEEEEKRTFYRESPAVSQRSDQIDVHTDHTGSIDTSSTPPSQPSPEESPEPVRQQPPQPAPRPAPKPKQRRDQMQPAPPQQQQEVQHQQQPQVHRQQPQQQIFNGEVVIDRSAPPPIPPDREVMIDRSAPPPIPPDRGYNTAPYNPYPPPSQPAPPPRTSPDIPQSPSPQQQDDRSTPDKEALFSFAWYHGSIPRDEAVARLTALGGFDG